MIRGLVDTDDLGGSLERIMANEGTREPIAQQLALIVQLLGGSGSTPVQSGILEAPLDGQLYARQSADWSSLTSIGPWQLCTYPAGCSGTLEARGVGNPTFTTIELIGHASSVATWDASYTFILAYLPAGLVPSGDRFALMPSSNTPLTPDSISCAWIKATGEIAVAFIYEKGPNPNIAWFNAAFRI